MFSWIADTVTSTAKWVFGIHEIDLFPEQDSAVEPGQKVILSGSFDELEPKIAIERFFEEVESFLRWPIDPITEYIMKSCDVTENGPDEFVVKVILDGKKLDSWNRGRGDGCDRVKTWKKVTLDRKALRIETSDYVPESTFGEWADQCDGKTVIANFYMACLKEPSRFECWLIRDGDRIAHQDFANFLYNAWTDPLIKSIKSEMNAKVQATIAPSPTNASVLSVVSDPLDAFIDYDTYFESMTKKTREFFEKMPDTVIEDEADGFTVKTTMKVDDKDVIQPKTVKFNHETGDLVITFHGADSKTHQTVHRVLHKSPLRLEAWNINDSGERKMTPSFLGQIKREVNDAIA